MKKNKIPAITLAALLSSSAACGPDYSDPLYCLSEAPSDEIINPYVINFEDNSKIPTSFDFCKLPKKVRDQMWEKIQEAEKTGNLVAGPLPDSFNYLEKDQDKIIVTKEEAYDIYSSHLAHKFWLDKSGLVPWKHSDYQEEDLQRLLRPAMFSVWDDIKGEFAFEYLIDHSPAETFQITQEMVPLEELTDQKSAMIKFVRSFRRFRHGSEHDINNSNDDDPTEINTMLDMFNERISRTGCWTMSPFVVQVAESYNIPGSTINGYYAGANHRGAIFQFTDQVIAHGDIFYNSQLDNTPPQKLFDNYKFWKENVLAYPRGNPEGAHNSLVNSKDNSRDYPSSNMGTHYCVLDGKGYLSDQFIDTKFGDFATPKQVEELAERIFHLTDGCKTIFPNLPEGKKLMSGDDLFGQYEGM